MSTERRHIEVSGIRVQIVRKDIKNLHLAVYPPDGRVRVAVPLRVSDEAARLAVVSRLGWIRRQQEALIQQERQSEREMIAGESHFVWGRRYRLSVAERDAPAGVAIRGARALELSVRPGSDRDKRQEVLHQWYRRLLRDELAKLLAKWEPVIGVQAASWGIKRMKTRWGTCNVDTRRIWLNLELTKKPPLCTEYIVVHELVHLLERHHNTRFASYMDEFMPQWRSYREELNRAPLAHEDWRY